ncbi:MAG: endonuclease III [Chloroflexi bacterium]|nr:endonuclease III [Chloroflexota bacterium]
MKKTGIDLILNLLVQSYGDRIWQKRLEPVGELVLTILSQNTSDTNSHRAFKSLVDTFGVWEKVAAADTTQIAAAIRAGGLASAKAKYIKSALLELKQETGNFNLLFLKKMDIYAAREWLVRLPGVGMKTASCVLLFSLGMPAFPVDTHVYRVTQRLGIIDRKTTVDAAHLELERLVPPQNIYRCHVLLIEHGRNVCKAQRPLCLACILKDICPSFKIFNQPT